MEPLSIEWWADKLVWANICVENIVEKKGDRLFGISWKECVGEKYTSGYISVYSWWVKLLFNKKKYMATFHLQAPHEENHSNKPRCKLQMIASFTPIRLLYHPSDFLLHRLIPCLIIFSSTSANPPQPQPQRYKKKTKNIFREYYWLTSFPTILPFLPLDQRWKETNPYTHIFVYIYFNSVFFHVARWAKVSDLYLSQVRSTCQLVAAQHPQHTMGLTLKISSSMYNVHKYVQLSCWFDGWVVSIHCRGYNVRLNERYSLSGPGQPSQFLLHRYGKIGSNQNVILAMWCQKCTAI